MISMALHKNFPSGGYSTGNLFDQQGVENSNLLQADGSCEFPFDGRKLRISAWAHCGPQRPSHDRACGLNKQSALSALHVWTGSIPAATPSFLVLRDRSIAKLVSVR